MSIIYILLALSVCVASGFLVAFLWSLHTGQYDDDYSPPRRILFDEFPKKSIEKLNSNISNNKYEN